jgi:hypothetical protein
VSGYPRGVFSYQRGVFNYQRGCGVINLLNLSLRYDIYILSKGQVTKRIDSPEECPPCIEGRLTPNHPVSLNLEPAIKITSVNPSTAYLPVDTTIHLPTRSSLIAHRGKKARSIRVETMN